MHVESQVVELGDVVIVEIVGQIHVAVPQQTLRHAQVLTFVPVQEGYLAKVEGVGAVDR